MNALEITYKGKGSEKQVALATEIFEKEMKKIRNAYENALQRAENGTMLYDWGDHWTNTLNNKKVITAIEAFAAQPASVTIEFRGFRGPNGSMSLANAIEKMIMATYQR